MPKVDIIIPAYNAARFLPFAIESVIRQTFSDWRILLVDDGSTDDTAAVVAPYLEDLGTKILYIRQANAGLPAARNAALRNASGELVALLDADDVWLPERLAETVRVFEGRPEVGLSHGFVARIDAEGRVIDVFDKRQKHSEGRVATYVYRRKINLPCPTITFRARCVEEIGMFDESMRATEDRDMWLRIAQRYEVALIPKVIAHYRVSSNSMSTDPDRMLNAQKQFIAKHYGTPGCGWIARRIAFSQAYKQRAEAQALRGQGKEALASSIHAMAYYPFDMGTFRTMTSLLWRNAKTQDNALG
jgi:glycosyltransferase involved in cell wall biosynthesis